MGICRGGVRGGKNRSVSGSSSKSSSSKKNRRQSWSLSHSLWIFFSLPCAHFASGFCSTARSTSFNTERNAARFRDLECKFCGVSILLVFCALLLSFSTVRVAHCSEHRCKELRFLGLGGHIWVEFVSLERGAPGAACRTSLWILKPRGSLFAFL